MNQTSNQELIKAKVRDTNASARLKEFKLEVQKGKYVSVEAVNKHLAKTNTLIRTKLLGLSTRIMPQITVIMPDADKQYLQRVIDSVVYEALEELADEYTE